MVAARSGGGAALAPSYCSAGHQPAITAANFVTDPRRVESNDPFAPLTDRATVH